MMKSARLEAFTDAVIAIVLTIMVLEIKLPAGRPLPALLALAPFLVAYAVSFATIAIFWINHHQMLHARQAINQSAMWANLFLLFWLTLVPFTVRWLTESNFEPIATASFGLVLALSALGYLLTERAIVACNPSEPDTDIRSRVSIAFYGFAIPIAFVHPALAIATYIGVIGVWLLPDHILDRVRSERSEVGKKVVQSGSASK